MNDSIPSHTDNDVESALGKVLRREPLCIAATDGFVHDRAIGLCESTNIGSNCVDEGSHPLFVDLDTLLVSSEGIDYDAESSSF
jgi:hypothetical protein